MGFDIFAFPHPREQMQHVAHLRTYMGAFERLKKEGYDWFALLGAYDCYGTVSGKNRGKYVPVEALNRALRVLEDFKPLPHSEGIRRKPQLRAFMEACVNWCRKTGNDRIYILFARYTVLKMELWEKQDKLKATILNFPVIPPNSRL